MSRLRWKLLAACLLVSISAGACTEAAPGKTDSQDAQSQADATPDVAEEDIRTSDIGVSDADFEGDADSQTGTIAIYLAGDLTQKTFNDGYSGQTPKIFEIALSKYDIQTSADPSTRISCYELDEPRVANLLRDNLMGTCQTASIPTDQYTHGRVKVDWVRFAVDGALNINEQGLPRTFTFFRAYSDTTYEGDSYDAGEAWVELGGGVNQRVAMDVDAPAPQGDGVHGELVDGEYWLTFPFERTLPIMQGNMQQHWSRFHWEISKSFRWQDATAPGYTDDVWDVHFTKPALTEQVFMTGVSGYHVTTSID